jgi:hypothetical protein
MPVLYCACCVRAYVHGVRFGRLPGVAYGPRQQGHVVQSVSWTTAGSGYKIIDRPVDAGGVGVSDQRGQVAHPVAEYGEEEGATAAYGLIGKYISIAEVPRPSICYKYVSMHHDSTPDRRAS